MKKDQVSSIPISDIPVSYIRHHIEVLKKQEEYYLYESDDDRDNMYRYEIMALEYLIKRWQKDSK